MKNPSRLAVALLAWGLSAGPAAAEQVYEITIRHWAATNNQGEVEVTWSARINPATPTNRTSTSSAGVLCAGDSTVWRWSSGSNPVIKQLSSRLDKARGTAMLKAQGTLRGQKPAKFWAVMGITCGSPTSAESNLHQSTINIVR
ncbi:MAG: hypothetical protein NDJ94_18590 [Vicinamibacteria bacterium]|nr:hypothetical protein [Vicinamibacteria bacterium]